MAKKGWFSLLKRFFISETPSNRKKEKKWRWVFGKHKIKRLPSLSAPRERIPSETEEEQREKPESLAVAAVTAVEVDEFTASHACTYQNKEETKELSDVNIQFNAPQSSCQSEKEIQDVGATKIQTAYRGYLARKALRALKGLVRLQAIIRGRTVRRQAILTLKRLQSIVNIQSQVCARRIRMAEGTSHWQENKELKGCRGKDIKIDINSQKMWDDSILSKEEENALSSSNREAAMKRERIKEYAFNHRMSTESEQSNVNGRWRYGLEQWVDTQLAKREDLQNSGTVSYTNARMKLRNLKGLDSPMHFPRRSFHHRKQSSIGDDTSASGSPVVPTYMAATESAKAKSRSMSSPRLRPISFDTYSDTASPYKHKLSPISSINSDATSSSRIGNPGSGLSQRSPSLKGVQVTVKSNRIFKDFRFNSECSLPNWD